MIYHKSILCIFVSLLSSLLSACAQTDPLADKVIIVVNSNEPHSLSIGRHYAEQRGIPLSNIVELKASTKETISVSEYTTTIANPLLDALLENGWVNGVKSVSKDRYGRNRLSVSVHEITFLVLIRGVPLRIANDPTLIEPSEASLPEGYRVTNGSVDSELALLLGPPGISMTSLIPNPYLENAAVLDVDANRILRVSRLDGPTKADVINLIDRSIEAEEVGLMGRAYIDLGGPHKKGDEWIRNTGELVEAAYFDTDFHTDRRKMDYRERLDAPAIYVGWYSHRPYAQWLSPKWSVPVGAIGYHLHSYNGTSVRNRKKWLGALVAQGYCATMGSVYEPYLEFTHRPDVMLTHLLEGGNFGEATMISTPALSWQSVAIGDPLYRPFKVSLSKQLEGSKKNQFASYASIREANRLFEEQGADAAIEFARAKFMEQPSLALAYKLALLYSRLSQDDRAIQVLKVVRYVSVFNEDEIVLVQKIANFLKKRGETQIAFDLYKRLLEIPNLDEKLMVSLYEGGTPIAREVEEPLLASRWTLLARQLKTKP